jgi:hypothetical protein
MLALPEARLAVGVKVAVRVRPVPLNALNVPPVVTMSASTKPTGASLNVKVTAEVSPAFRVLTLLVMVSVGAKVSMLMLGVVPAPPAFVAASV